jgi:STE24 endopeptidase
MATLILSLLIVMYILDLIVTYLNTSQRKKPLPENVKDIYDESSYVKWLSYTMEKLQLELIHKTLNIGVLVCLLGFGFFGVLESFTKEVLSNPILQTLLFLGIFMGLQMILDLPFEIIDTFKIEAKYGFNKTTKKTFWIDQLKGLVLGSVLMGSLISVMMVLFQAFQDQILIFMLILWIFISVVLLLIFVLNTKVFVRLFNKLKPIEEGELKDKITALAKKTGFEVKAISSMDASKRSTKLNGFYSGLGKIGEIVLYDTLISKLSIDQILAVLAHELGHAKHKDTLRMLVVQIMILGLYACGIGLILQMPVFFIAFGLEGIHFGFAFILFSILMEPLSLLLQIPVNILLRRAEYKADAFSVKMTSKKDMTEVMKILVTENFSNLNPHPLTVLLHYSHPPVSQRLQAIENLEN